MFAVKQQNLQLLHDTLMDVSTPTSPKYGQHLSNERVQALTAPKPADLATVRSFLSSRGHSVRAATPNSDVLSVEVTIEEAEALLSAKYHQYKHARTGATVHRALHGYHLPEAVAKAIDLVAPTDHLPGTRLLNTSQMLVERQAGSQGSRNNVPKSLRTLYSIGEGVTGKAKGNKQAVTAFLNQEYSASDLKSFWDSYCSGITCGDGLPKLVGDATTGEEHAPSLMAAPFKWLSTIGENPPFFAGSAGVESMLDIETITGVAGGTHSFTRHAEP